MGTFPAPGLPRVGALAGTRPQLYFDIILSQPYFDTCISQPWGPYLSLTPSGGLASFEGSNHRPHLATCQPTRTHAVKMPNAADEGEDMSLDKHSFGDGAPPVVGCTSPQTSSC